MQENSLQPFCAHASNKGFNQNTKPTAQKKTGEGGMRFLKTNKAAVH